MMLPRLLPAMLLLLLLLATFALSRPLALPQPTMQAPRLSMRTGQTPPPRLQAIRPRRLPHEPLRAAPLAWPLADTDAPTRVHAEPPLAMRRMYRSSRTVHVRAPAPRA
jgi:hypothetical protein